jgi:threonine synthase
MAERYTLRCVLCGASPEAEARTYTCPRCGLDGTLDVCYDMSALRGRVTGETFEATGRQDLWRYASLLPVTTRASIPPLQVGWTPLYASAKLAETYGVAEVHVKDEGRNPTASLKDRASAVALAKALDFGQKAIACASTGNAASSLAGFSAVAGLPCYIFVPERAPAAKVAQLLVYGATVVLVRGDYAAAFDLATWAIERFGWYNRNCAINPYLVEGKKTCGLEIAEQLAWRMPHRIFISVGDGCCISGLYKAFRDLADLGLIDALPRLVGVQAEGCAPIAEAFGAGAERVTFRSGDTLADSIAVGAPRNWAKALRAVRESRGDMVRVGDGEILSAMTELARTVGVFGEPAGVTAFAGFRKMALEGKIGRDERVVIVVTGNGLKDIDSARKAVQEPLLVDPDPEDLLRKLGNIARQGR